MSNIEKNINDLPEEEFGRLFPVEIVSYNDKWPFFFQREKSLILKTLGDSIVIRIEHFGSTAVSGLSAKPTIDILIEILQLTENLKEKIVRKMTAIDYDFIWRTDNAVPYMWFTKGYSKEGFQGQIFHIHIADKNHSLWDRLHFRDYLREHTKVAKEYERLKFELAKKHKYNREDYTKAKTDFVRRITEIAKKN